tara:strand:- start:711 stop:1139 length:429 start_codon:yes stop_codon:yes gene_type:complete
MYKLSEDTVDIRNYTVKILNKDAISREVKEEVAKSFLSNSNIDNDFIIEISINENLDPLIKNTDGTVSKYRVEIVIDFKIRNNKENKYLMEDTVRGFAQYTVEISEIESEDKKKRMTRTAANSAIQMMVSKIQSDTLITNDN